MLTKNEERSLYFSKNQYSIYEEYFGCSFDHVFLYKIELTTMLFTKFDLAKHDIQLKVNKHLV